MLASCKTCIPGTLILSLLVWIILYHVNVHQPLSLYFSPPIPNTKQVSNDKTFIPATLIQKKEPGYNFRKAMDGLNSLKVGMDDPRLIRLIRDYYIEPPSTLPYVLKKPNRLEYSNGQTPFVDSRLNYIENGFYIECGALDGEKGSNTLFFEKVRRWNGILIEANPDNYMMLKNKNRKAFTINACLNTDAFPAMVEFNKAYNVGRIIAKQPSRQAHNNPVEMQCFPLYSILLALNRTTVDFFSLDVEGDELSVLKTIPFYKVNIKMITVEYAHSKGGYRALQKYMALQGYDTLLRMEADNGGVADVIFRKKGLNH